MQTGKPFEKGVPGERAQDPLVAQCLAAHRFGHTGNRQTAKQEPDSKDKHSKRQTQSHATADTEVPTHGLRALAPA